MVFVCRGMPLFLGNTWLSIQGQRDIMSTLISKVQKIKIERQKDKSNVLKCHLENVGGRYTEKGLKYVKLSSTLNSKSITSL